MGQSQQAIQVRCGVYRYHHAKNGAGLHTASTCFWDTRSDGSCSVRWDNATMRAIVTVFALHI